MPASQAEGAALGSASQFVNRSAQEHLLYIQEKVNPILEALVTAVLLERPEDPSYFMLKWLCEQTKSLDAGDRGGSSTAEEIETVRNEIQKLKDRKAELLAKRAKGEESSSSKAEDKPKGADSKADAKSDKSTKADEDEDEEEEDDDDDCPDVMPEPPKMNRGPRQSVSAEAYGHWNKKGDFTAPVYEKTSEQKERIAKCLETSFLFSALDKEEIATVILAFKEKVVEPDARLIEQGDDGESMFVIEEGKVECFKKIDGADKMVKTCSAGDVFGELALLYNCPRAASVVSTEKTQLWELDRETFNRIVKDAAAKKRTTYTDFLKKVPLFTNIDQYEMMTIADALRVEVYEGEGTQIIQQGDSGDKFFVTLEGECVAKKFFVPGQEPRKVMMHKVGDYFGELSLLKNEPRAASVFTSTPTVKLLSMDRKTFKRLMGPIEDILRREAKRYEVQLE
mmetsp:Transcript_70718/g.160622  ORF Transcript_70718/g.160622 Transcript_70718/m.160622 type:complete len:453 (-) Transcript_70718:125-1483(-)